MSKSESARRKNGSRGGRPRGSKTIEREQSIVEASRCPRCQSTEREKYVGEPFRTHLRGVRDGKPYNVIIRRRTRCKSCGQARFDLSYELVGSITAS